MKNYIGVKMIQAEPMMLGDYNVFKGWTIPPDEDPYREGYKVVYSDDYISWSPKEVFEQAYFAIEDPNGTKIMQEDVDNFISTIEDCMIGQKTTVVMATLINGYEIIESSSCVDPANFNQDLGIELSMRRVKDQVWHLLGFMLQHAKRGII